MESLTLLVDGPITGRAYTWRGLKPEYFFCLQVDGPISGRAYKRGACNRDFMVFVFSSYLHQETCSQARPDRQTDEKKVCNGQRAFQTFFQFADLFSPV